MALKHKNYPLLKKLLDKASRHAETRMNWYSLFKRSYLAGQQQGDYRDFQDLVSRSCRFYKGGADLEAINIAALLWTDQYEKAAASLYAIQNERYETLVAETLISWDVFRKYDLDGKAPLDFVKEKITYKEDPEFFESIGEKSGNPALLYNAALLSMRAGDFDRCASIIPELPASRIDPYRQGILHYDLGDFEAALNAFEAQLLLDEVKGNQRPSIYQLCGDLLHLSNPDKALAYYSKAIQLDGWGQWKNYRNISRILMDEGRSRQARDVLRAGMELYSDNMELLTDYTMCFGTDEPLDTKERLKAYMASHPEQTTPQLLMIRYFPQKGSTVQYQSRLWELFNQDPFNADVSRFLLWYLAGVEDLESMKIVMERYGKSGFSPFWYDFYKAFMALKKNRIQEALGSMKEAYRKCPQWYMAHNLAILQRITGNWPAAESLLEEAASDLLKQDRVKNPNTFLSRIFYEQAVLFLEDDNYEKASAALEKAILQDSQNLRAVTLLNRIQ